MNEVLEAARQLQAVCTVQEWRFCFIGGLAQLRWGQPRVTVDADLSLLTGFGGERPFVQTLLARFEPRIRDAEQFALANRVLLLKSASGVGLDVTLAGLPYEEEVIARSTDFEFAPQMALRTCSAEDLVVMKAFAGRGQDWVDVDRVIVRQMAALDWNYIRRQLTPLAEVKGESDLVERLDRHRAEMET